MMQNLNVGLKTTENQSLSAIENFSIFLVNLELARKILVPSRNRVLQLQTAISSELFKSEKRFIQRSKEEHQGFQINF